MSEAGKGRGRLGECGASADAVVTCRRVTRRIIWDFCSFHWSIMYTCGVDARHGWARGRDAGGDTRIAHRGYLEHVAHEEGLQREGEK